MKLIITGGHHSSAMPVIAKLRQKSDNVQIYWIGHRHSLKNDQNDTLEYKEITALNIPFYELETGKIYRALSLRNGFKVVKGFVSAHRLVSQIKPDLIMSFGGYIAAPVVLAGWLLNIPILTHEQTSTVGYANRFIGLFARKVLISWKSSARYFPKNKVIFCGLPLRRSVFEVKSNSFNFDNKLPTIFILAGKSGSTLINRLVLESLNELLSMSNLIHQCGDYSVANDYQKLSEKYDALRNQVNGTYVLRKFILEHEIGEAFAKSTLIVSRSGAHAISEILALEKPALLIPIAWVSHNEQFQNAMIVKNAGLAEILEEKDLTKENFIERIKYMLHNLATFKNKSVVNIKDVSQNSIDLITNEIFKYSK